MTRLKLANRLPINLLDVRAIRSKPFPWELEGVKHYGLLQERTNQSGLNNEVIAANDLSSRTSFALWGQAGTWSLPHIDHHGVYTAVLNEERQKLWLSWNLTDAELENGPMTAPRNLTVFVLSYQHFPFPCALAIFCYSPRALYTARCYCQMSSCTAYSSGPPRRCGLQHIEPG